LEFRHCGQSREFYYLLRRAGKHQTDVEISPAIKRIIIKNPTGISLG
jgi:hypothetical protein